MGDDKDNVDDNDDHSWFANFYNWIKERFIALGQWFQNLGNRIGLFFDNLWLNIKNSFAEFILKCADWFSNVYQWFESLSTSLGNWFASVGQWFSDLGTNLGNWFSNVGQWFSDLWTNITNFFTKKDQDEREETSDKSDDMSNTANEINSVLDNKFGAFYTLKDFLVDFWNALNNSGDNPPEFYVTFPSFLGGGTFNILDLGFYNDYRTYIHGIIAGVCYFVYIKRIYTKIPNIIHN